MCALAEECGDRGSTPIRKPDIHCKLKQGKEVAIMDKKMVGLASLHEIVNVLGRKLQGETKECSNRRVSCATSILRVCPTVTSCWLCPYVSSVNAFLLRFIPVDV